MLRRESVYRRRYQSHAEARADIFDYIKRILQSDPAPTNFLIQLSVEMG
jgi:hypothetical protein